MVSNFFNIIYYFDPLISRAFQDCFLRGFQTLKNFKEFVRNLKGILWKKTTMSSALKNLYFQESMGTLSVTSTIRAVRVAQWQDRCSKLTSAPVTSEVVGSIPGHVSDREPRATLSDSVGFLRGLRFPPTYITNRPILCMELIMS
jgi:hypothetical protein